MNNLIKITANGTDFKVGNPIKYTWDETSNMNNFKTPGVYEIYGERTVKTDNLPIMNDGSGHSIAAKLIVVASTLQPANNEICITQFLMLSNRIGGDGNMYIRTYTENNNGMNGWSPWQKQMGMVETLINGNDVTVGQDIFSHYQVNKIGDGLNGMVNNGVYSGIYIDALNYTGADETGDLCGFTSSPKLIETFVLIVINDYAISGQLNNPRHITQLKYAVDSETGESTIKKRVGTGNDTISWGDWEDNIGSKTILWDESSNMDFFKTAGTYEIYGERRNLSDNLPILNSNPGHSIAARLTVVDSSLRKDDGTPATEMCITQFLMLSNRIGSDGNMYIRTYNRNNNGINSWSSWQKLQGVREGYIFTDSIQVNPDGGTQQITGVTGLNNMIDNGIYTGIYTDDPSFTSPTFIDTFTLIVINNYAVAGKDERLKRTISQLKYAVDAITNQASVKQRTITDGDTAWSDWTDIGGGGTQEVDISDAVRTYGLPALIAQGFAKEGVTYIFKGRVDDISNNNGVYIKKFDNNDKLRTFIASKIADGIDCTANCIIKMKYNPNYNNFDGTTHNIIKGEVYMVNYYFNFYIHHLNTANETVLVSADMTQL